MQSLRHISLAKKLIVYTTLVYIILFIISFSFPHEIIPDIGKYLTGFFETISSWFAENILKIKPPYTSALISDSTGFYVNALVLLIISIILAAIWIFLEKGKTKYIQVKYWLITFCRYYLTMQLLAYAFSKIFKSQFYLPEPNTLFTTMGQTPRDLLYWSVMGTSRAYNIFMGCLELFAACLLLFRRTSLFGALFSAGILTNIVAINFSYDISVKLYSCFLLLLSLIIIVPKLRLLIQFFFLERNIQDNKRAANYYRQAPMVYLIVKAVIIILLFTDAVLPYIKANNFNDDNASRPAFHGGYFVKTFKSNNNLPEPNIHDTKRWKRVFLHREGYFIIQFMNDEMKDLKLSVDKNRQQLLLTDYDSSRFILNYSASGNMLQKISGKINGNELEAELEKIDLEKLPLLQNEFHWTIDEINH